MTTSDPAVQPPFCEVHGCRGRWAADLPHTLCGKASATAVPRRHDWLQRLWWRWLWSDRKARDPFTGFLVHEYRRLTEMAHDCGHFCCDERSDPTHDHFLSPSECPSCSTRAQTLADIDAADEDD